MIKKGLAVAVILLFIGVAFAIPINANVSKSSLNPVTDIEVLEEEIEYIIQIVREDEIVERTVFLTEQKANELDTLIEQIKIDLDSSKSTEGTTQIFNEAVDSFNELEFFPEDISINEIKQLITGENRNLDKIRFKSEMGDGFENRLCLVAGQTTHTLSVGPVVLGTIFCLIPAMVITATISNIIDTLNLSDRIIGKILTFFTTIFVNMPALFLIYLSAMSVFSIQPVSIGSFITHGVRHESFDPWTEPSYDPSNGWIYTIGLNGIKNYSGKFYGKLTRLWFLFLTVYSGIVGFTGINILREEKTPSVFYLGFALKAGIDTSQPSDSIINMGYFLL